MKQRALASNFREATARALQYQREQNCHSLDAGTDHSVVGGLIVGHWHLSPTIVEVIGAHHLPQRAGPVGLINLADDMAHALDLSQLEQELVPPLSMSAWMRGRT